MEKNAVREPAITVRGGIFLIGFGAAIGFSVGTWWGARDIRRDLEELEILHADTRTRVFALDTIGEAEEIVRGEPPVTEELCRECGRIERDLHHNPADAPFSHTFAGPNDPIFPAAREELGDGDKSPGTETP